MINREDEYAIIILNYNNANLTVETIKNIKKLNKNIKVVIVDNCSTDDSKTILESNFNEEESIFLLFNNCNSGYAAGNNVGFKFVRENLKDVKYSFVMNPDIKIQDISVIYNMINALKNDDKLAAVTALTIYNGKLRFPNDAAWKMVDKKYLILSGTILGKIIKPNIRYKKLDINSDNVAYVDIIQGCFFAIKMNIIEEIGFLDENTFLYGEEIILAKKLKYLNFLEGIVINSFIRHNHQEKNKKMMYKKNKLFDMKCFYDSRKYIIEKYSNGSKFYIVCAKLFLNFDYQLKKFIIQMKKNN